MRHWRASRLRKCLAITQQLNTKKLATMAAASGPSTLCSLMTDNTVDGGLIVTKKINFVVMFLQGCARNQLRTTPIQFSVADVVGRRRLVDTLPHSEHQRKKLVHMRSDCLPWVMETSGCLKRPEALGFSVADDEPRLVWIRQR